MTIEEIEIYKKNPKIGDRIRCKYYSNIWYVIEVHERGVQLSLNEKRPDHSHLMEWASLKEYNVIHKEP